MSSNVPEGWRTTSLGSAINFINGYAFKPEDWCRAGVPIIRIQNLNGSDGFNYYDGTIPERYHVNAGDLLFCWSGSRGTSFGARKWTGHLGYLNQHIFRCEVSRDLDDEFAFFLLEGMTGAIETEAHGGGGLVHIKKSEIIKFDALLPPLDEQRRIAEVLRSVDDAIAANEAVALQSNRAYHAALSELMGSASDHGEAVELSQIAELTLGKMLDKAKNKGELRPYLANINVRWGAFDLHDLRHMRFEERELDRYGLRYGDIVMCEGGEPGRCALWMDEEPGMMIQKALHRIRPNERVDNQYLHYALVGAVLSGECDEYMTGSGIKHLPGNQLAKIKVPLPSIEEQRRIAEALRLLEQATAAKQDALEQARQTKLNLVSDLLSGRVRVPARTSSGASVVPAAFKRAVFAAEIVHQLHNDNRFGSVKHEKIVHLCELHLDLHNELDRHAYKKAAGPYDPVARRSVEHIFRQQKWFDTAKPDGNRVVYSALENAGEHRSYFDRYFGEQKASIQSIIDLLRPLDTERCEMIATTYAVWNDFIIDGHQPSDEEIVASILAWHPRKARISEDRWSAVLPWMRQQGLVPRGTGEKTRTAFK